MPNNMEDMKKVFENIFSIECDDALRYDLDTLEVIDMDCAITDLNHSAWSVHKVNLFEAFDEAGMTNMPRPM